MTRILTIPILSILLLSCGSRKTSPDSGDSASVEIDTATRGATIPNPHAFEFSDGEREHAHPLTPEQQEYHASRGVSTLEEAYLEGYDDGYEDGEEDGANGVDYGLSFDPDDHAFSGSFADSYEAGYEDGYHDGYHTNFKIYKKYDRFPETSEDDDDDDEDEE